MPLSDNTRRQILLAEIEVLIDRLNTGQLSAHGYRLAIPKEEIETMTIEELDGLKRELRDLARSLGGTNPRN